MSDTIFLDPVNLDKKTIFVKVINTSDNQSVDINKEILSAFLEKGYSIASNPEDAYYILQVNILQFGKAKDSDSAFSALPGAVIGGGAVLIGSDKPTQGNILAGALMGSAIEYIADSAIQVCYYSITTDIQISEKSNVGEVKIETKGSQGKDKTKMTYSEKSGRKKYNTRIVSVAKKTNLKFENAKPEMTKSLISSIVGLF